MRVWGIIGLVLALLVLWAGPGGVGESWMFLDIPSIVMVVGWAVAVGIMTFGVSEFLSGVRAIGILFRRSPASPPPATAVAVLRSLRRNLYAGGALGVLIGIVGLLSNLDDPSRMGPALALAFLSVISAVVLAELLCRPAVERLTADHAGEGASGNSGE